MTTTSDAAADTTVTPLQDRCRGALLGLALGDAIGFPALYHRMARLPDQRALMLNQALELDAHQVNKIPMPFTLGPPDALFLSGTDDTEFAVVTALILLQSSASPTEEEILAGWRRHVVDHEDEIWSGVSERASIDNIAKGMKPPVSGNDNPHHFDDGAVSRAIPIGIHYAGRPTEAAAIARAFASVTNAEDGVVAAQSMAVTISLLADGRSQSEALDAGYAQIPNHTWLGRNLRRSLDILDSAGSGFDAVVRWSHEIANNSYNFGNIAAETLPLAYAITSATTSLQQALGLAAMIPKQADSLPAMVGALAGAHFGLAGFGAWAEQLDLVRGVCVPTTAGYRLMTLADALCADEPGQRDSLE